MKRALILAAPAVLVFGLVACGDDDDDSPDVTTADTVTEDTETEDTETDETDGEETIPDITGITIPDITFPGGTLPDISIPDISIPDLESLIQEVFPRLDEDQVECLVDQSGEDFDPNEVMDLLDECNIEASDLQPGG